MLSNFKKKKNLRQLKAGKPFWNFNNIILGIAVFLALPSCAFTTFYYLFSSSASSLYFLNSSTESPHATSIPWIDNASECQYTHRNWHDNKCWDDEHSPTF